MTTSDNLNTVQILKGQRFGKDFTGTFKTKECSLKQAPNKKLYCIIQDESSNKTVWVAVSGPEDVVFTLSEVNQKRVELAKEEIKEMDEEIAMPEETEEEALDRIKHRFDILQRLVKGVCAGAIKSLVVSGPAGVGKSHGIETELADQSILGGFKYEVIKGTATPIYLYQKMHEFKEARDILVFDDCDSVFFDPLSLNLFKAALDSSKRRMLTWGSESRILNDKNVPNSFEFKGSIIFISNIKFDKIRSESLKDHLKAIESRSHYLDLTIDSAKDKMLRIKQVVRDSGILAEYNFGKEKEADLVSYIETHTSNLRELSLRTIKKVADLAYYTDDWRSIADVTCQYRPRP